MTKKINTLQVLVALPFNKEFLYKEPVNSKIKTGQIVKVPFGKKSTIGLVTGKEEFTTNEIEFTLKDVLEVYDLPPINATILKFLKWVASYNMIPTGNIIKMLLLNEKNLAYQIEPTPQQQKEHVKPTRLSDIQQNIADDIIKTGLQSFRTHLILGATGSGKTEVYLDIAKQVLAKKKQVLILLPEILLTTQLMSRFTQRLNNHHIAQWHSSLTPKKRAIIWHRVLRGDIQIIVSARSGLFLPFKNLGLIIIDEEHDGSFKQEEGTIYNARDMAIIYAKISKFPVILTSATPSAETFQNASKGKYQLHRIDQRFTGVEFPEVQIVDMTTQITKHKQWVSTALREEIQKCISQGDLAMIFLNRRGYTTLTLCGNCGEKFACPDCEFWLVEHKTLGQMLCHYCGYKQETLIECPQCNSDKKLLAFGPGIEKIAEELKSYFIDARIAVLSSDTIANVKKASAMLESISNKEYDIILGTQMLAKGLNFPKLQLVGVIDADIGNSGFDMRIMEKTFQLLYQVAGRAGREHNKGLVLLQTYQPDSNLLAHICNWQYDAFIKQELKNREIATMPPFARLILLRGSSFHEHVLQSFMQLLLQKSLPQNGLTFFGPAPAPMYKIRNKYRWQIILKITQSFDVRNYINTWLDSVDIPPSVNLKIDIDPYNFN
jgi:primosomal protein N' (replication factor Y)